MSLKPLQSAAILAATVYAAIMLFLSLRQDSLIYYPDLPS